MVADLSLFKIVIKVEVPRDDKLLTAQAIAATYIFHTKMAETPLDDLHHQSVESFATVMAVSFLVSLRKFVEEFFCLFRSIFLPFQDCIVLVKMYHIWILHLSLFIDLFVTHPSLPDAIIILVVVVLYKVLDVAIKACELCPTCFFNCWPSFLHRESIIQVRVVATCFLWETLGISIQSFQRVLLFENLLHLMFLLKLYSISLIPVWAPCTQQ